MVFTELRRGMALCFEEPPEVTALVYKVTNGVVGMHACSGIMHAQH